MAMGQRLRRLPGRDKGGTAAFLCKVVSIILPISRVLVTTHTSNARIGRYKLPKCDMTQQEQVHAPVMATVTAATAMWALIFPRQKIVPN